jgi:hypothetical protein
MHWSLFLLAAPLCALAQWKATFTEYGSGDINNSPNCATTVNACGTPQPGFTAAISQAQFGVEPNQGAGPACGTCCHLTIDKDLNGEPVTQKSITVKVNNLCPIKWNPICNVPNQYGGQVHFDLCIDSGAPAAFFTSSSAGIGTATEVSC